MDKLSHYSKSLYLETLTYQILVHKTTKQEQRCYLKGLGKDDLCHKVKKQCGI